MARTKILGKVDAALPKSNPERVIEMGALDNWLDSLPNKTSPQTMRTYRSGVEKFAAWLADNGQPVMVETVERPQVQAWVREIERSMKPSSVTIYYRAVSLFFGWAEDEEMIDLTPARKIRRTTRVEAPKRQPMSEDEFDRMLDACKGSTFTDLRDRAILNLLMDAGMRRSELVKLDVADLEFTDPDDYRSKSGGSAEVRVSKTFARRAFFSKETAKSLHRYLIARRKKVRKLPADTGALFLGPNGEMKPDSITAMVKRVAQRAGIDRNVHPHLLRHTWTGNRLAAGDSDEIVMRMGGWKNRDMLDRYSAGSADARVEAHVNATGFARDAA